jgi:hypothetical protein
MVCPPATSEAGARWPRFGLVVATTTSRRDNKDQMIRPLRGRAQSLFNVISIFCRYTIIWRSKKNRLKNIDAGSITAASFIPYSDGMAVDARLQSS